MESEDRSVASAAGQDAKTAGGVAGGYGTGAGQIAGSILPTLTQQATNPTGFDPTTKNDMLVAGEQGAGGTNAAITGQAGLEAGRTRNSGATSSILDQAARRMGQTNSQNALNVENASANLANDKQQAAQKGLEGLYGTDVGAQLKGMGLQNEDLNTELQAGKSGWLQDVEGGLDTLGGLASSASKGPLTYV